MLKFVLKFSSLKLLYKRFFNSSNDLRTQILVILFKTLLLLVSEVMFTWFRKSLSTLFLMKWKAMKLKWFERTWKVWLLHKMEWFYFSTFEPYSNSLLIEDLLTYRVSIGSQQVEPTLTKTHLKQFQPNDIVIII